MEKYSLSDPHPLCSAIAALGASIAVAHGRQDNTFQRNFVEAMTAVRREIDESNYGGKHKAQALVAIDLTLQFLNDIDAEMP